MMDETIFLGDCPVIRPEGIYLNGQRVIRLGMGGVGVGDVGDLLAYRQEWEPFIAAHLALWRKLNALLEDTPMARQQCPAGIFNVSKVTTTNPTTQAFCVALSLTRARTSDTDPGGILRQWNAWKDRSSGEMVAGAASMLEWHQQVVMDVGGKYKDELVRLGKFYDIAIQLPDLPRFSTQQEIIARIEGAYITAKGVLQIIGYKAGEVLGMASSVTQAVADGLTDTAKQLPKTTRWIGIAAVVAAVVVGGALIIYYVPKRRAAPSPAPSLPSPSPV
jgi:hypothetical protein